MNACIITMFESVGLDYCFDQCPVVDHCLDYFLTYARWLTIVGIIVLTIVLCCIVKIIVLTVSLIIVELNFLVIVLSIVEIIVLIIILNIKFIILLFPNFVKTNIWVLGLIFGSDFICFPLRFLCSSFWLLESL